MDKRVTIYDIAARLGISTATVNRALTGKPRVKEQTRELVLKTAAEMGFKPNTLARSLARRRLKLAVLGFTSFPEFHGQFLKGARDAGAELEDFNTQVDYFSYDDGATNTPESDAFLEQTLRRIQTDYADELSVSEIAEQLGISSNYLSKLFKEETGTGFAVYLTDYRIERSIALMKEHTLPLSQIAERCGFRQYTYFTNVFKKKTGKSPRAYLSEV